MELEAQLVARVLPATAAAAAASSSSSSAAPTFGVSDDSTAVCLVATSVKVDGQGQALHIQVKKQGGVQ